MFSVLPGAYKDSSTMLKMLKMFLKICVENTACENVWVVLQLDLPVLCKTVSATDMQRRTNAKLHLIVSVPVICAITIQLNLILSRNKCIYLVHI